MKELSNISNFWMKNIKFYNIEFRIIKIRFVQKIQIFNLKIEKFIKWKKFVIFRSKLKNLGNSSRIWNFIDIDLRKVKLKFSINISHFWKK